jgi:BirA family transcriptional regulator, biotin operon repressor / biotin---[acetyl-CoA-carboxylase] ligase
MRDSDQLLSADAITAVLMTGIIGRRVLYYPRLPTTMDVARDEARKGADEGTVVIAGEQTAGRGRLKRSWFAPSGNIALSVLLYPHPTELPTLIMLASLSVARSIETVAGLKPEVKWPNDILIRGRKVCGILIETDARPSSAGTVSYAIIGIGVNVRLNPAAYSEIENTATSLSQEAGKEVTRLEFVRSLLSEMDTLYLQMKSGTSLFGEWQQRLVTLGRRVTVTSVDSVFEGIAEFVEPDGSLFVRCAGGELRRVVAGDVTLKSPGALPDGQR